MKPIKIPIVPDSFTSGKTELNNCKLCFPLIKYIFIQIMFGHGFDRVKSAEVQNAGEHTVSAGLDGFKFFKRNSTFGSVADNGVALREIEKEMLLIRKQYVDGHILQDVYVAETRRLYNIAKPLRP